MIAHTPYMTVLLRFETWTFKILKLSETKDVIGSFKIRNLQGLLIIMREIQVKLRNVKKKNSNFLQIF